MEGVRGQYLQNQHKGLAFGSLNFSDHLGLDVSSNKNADVLSQEVQNLALKDSTKGNGTVQRNKRHYYPLRPEAENCLFFMRYGWCKYGENCRYNHQFSGRSQADYKENAKLNEENLYRMAQVECKGASMEKLVDTITLDGKLRRLQFWSLISLAFPFDRERKNALNTCEMVHASMVQTVGLIIRILHQWEKDFLFMDILVGKMLCIIQHNVLHTLKGLDIRLTRS